MKIAVVGTGYVGLVSGTCFAETGNKVVCVDIDSEKVKRLSAGEITIYEPGLEKIFLRNQKDGRLTFTGDLEHAIRDAQIIFLALPTPPGEDGSADLQYILKASTDIGKYLPEHSYKVIVDKSTVPVGTAAKVREAVQNSADAAGRRINFDIVSNPEFLREGVAVEDFMKPDRVVIGTKSERAITIMNELYGPFVRQGNPIIVMDEESAELTKYAANAFLATKISFMNEIAQLCERVGADVDLIRHGMGADERIGRRFLFPGIGYGGSCFPKDVKALANTSKENKYGFHILDAVLKVNANQKTHLLPKMQARLGTLKGKKIAVWGLSFKPNTDDIREAPAFAMIDELLKAGAEISAFDPEAMQNAQKHYGNKIGFVEDQYTALADADALLIATEWSEFRTPDFEKIEMLMKNKLIFDGRNLFDPDQMEKMKFNYVSIGRREINIA